MKLPSREKGDLEVLVIRSRGGVWEGDWDLLRGTVVGDLFSKTTQVELDHILRGFSKPFVDALGIPPVGALLKLPSSECAKRRGCTFYDARKCHVTVKKDVLPLCFELALNLPPEAQTLLTEVVFQWRQGVYLVVVEAHDR